MTEIEKKLLITVAAQNQALLAIAKYTHDGFIGHMEHFHDVPSMRQKTHFVGALQQFQNTVLSDLDYGDEKLNDEIFERTKQILKDFVQ